MCHDFLASYRAGKLFSTRLEDINITYFGSRIMLTCNYDANQLYIDTNDDVIINQPSSYPAGIYEGISQPHQISHQNVSKIDITPQNTAMPVVLGSNVNFIRADTVAYVTPVEATAYANTDNIDDIPPPLTRPSNQM